VFAAVAQCRLASHLASPKAVRRFNSLSADDSPHRFQFTGWAAVAQLFTDEGKGRFDMMFKAIALALCSLIPSQFVGFHNRS